MRKIIYFTLIICASFVLGMKTQKRIGFSNDRIISLPEEWGLLKTGDTLRVIKADSRQIELGFYNKRNR